MTLEFNPYNILGVPANADSDTIKIVYRRLAQRLHPDRNPNNPGAAAQFQHINAAYELLSDRVQREYYDKNFASKQQEADSEAYFTMRVTPSARSLMVIPEEQVIYLLAEVFPPPDARQIAVEKPKLNLALVLDHSKSMEKDGRMRRVKAAAHAIIEEMAANDIISVVTFNDYANTIIPATTVTDKAALRTRITMIEPAGSTEIFNGLNAGIKQVRKYLGPSMVNHVILLTDGRTFDDEAASIKLAQQAATEGISISTMGLGEEWNDKFLDDLASATGGNSMYINSVNKVVRFMNSHVRNLSQAFSDRMQISVAPDPNIRLEMAFQLLPQPQPLESSLGILPVSSLQAKRQISVLMQLQLPANLKPGFRSIARIVSSGLILRGGGKNYQTVSDLSMEVSEKAEKESPPQIILDALGKLTLYRMQEKAREAVERGDIEEATRRLENLATRLLEQGQPELAQQVLAEARSVAKTHAFTEQGSKTIKYHTRALVSPESIASTLMLSDGGDTA